MKWQKRRNEAEKLEAAADQPYQNCCVDSSNIVLLLLLHNDATAEMTA